MTRHATEPGDAPVSGSRTFCVVVADASRARVLVLEPETGDAASELVEVAEITNPLVRARSAAGRHEIRHEIRHQIRNEIERHFAAEIAAEAAAVWACYPPCELILVAGPAMLAVLRPAIRARTGGPSGIHELARDLVKLSGPRLRDELAGAGLVPARGAAVHRSGLAGWR